MEDVGVLLKAGASLEKEFTATIRRPSRLPVDHVLWPIIVDVGGQNKFFS
jgi:hypothetical protein